MPAVKLVPTRRSDYGIRALLYLARSDQPRIKAAEISEAMEIPKGFLHQILQSLQRGGLVTSQTSRNGGYALARPATDISLRQIIEALEGPLAATECALRGGPCHWDDVCALHWVWSAARQALADQLDAATLFEVAEADAALAAGSIARPADSHRAPRA